VQETARVVRPLFIRGCRETRKRQTDPCCTIDDGRRSVLSQKHHRREAKRRESLERARPSPYADDSDTSVARTHRSSRMRYTPPALWRRHGLAVPAMSVLALASALLAQAQAGPGAQQPPAAVSPPSLAGVVVDPGHGGDDHGAVGATGIEEKALVLGVAQRLQSLAALHGGIRVRLTRDDDRALTLDQRATAANSSPGILFVSLHANFSPSPKTAGVEVGTYRAAGPARQEVRIAPRRSGPAPPAPPVSRWAALVRWDQAQAQHVERASVVAQRLVERFRAMGTVGPRAWFQAPLKPLSAVNMPGVLVELGYLSNADDEGALVSEERQAALAQAVLDVVLASIENGALPAGPR